MESFYDREAGVAWGPITLEEMLDDIYLYKSMNVEKRMTLSCPPTFVEKHQRYHKLTQQNLSTEESEINLCPNRKESEDLIVISSDDEEEIKGAFQPDFKDTNSQNYSHEENINNVDNRNETGDTNIKTKSPDYSKICMKEDSIQENDVYNQESQYRNVRNRLPTPANLEDTCDEICVSDYERDKSTSEIIEATVWDEDQYEEGRKNLDGSKVQEEEDQEGSDFSRLKQIFGDTGSTGYSFSAESMEDYKPSASVDEINQQEIHKESCNDTAKEESSLLRLLEHTSFWSLDAVEQPENLYTTFNSDDGNEELNALSAKEKSFKIPVIVIEESHEDHGYFNDTLEEMNRLLNEGVDYSMSTNGAETDAEKSSMQDKFAKGREPSTPINNVKQNFETKSNSSPSYLKKGTVNKKPIKTDMKPPRIPVLIREKQKKLFPKRTLTPTNSSKPTSLVSAKNRFKDIESPISVYIKNSGKTPLYRKVTPSKPLTYDKVRVQTRSVEKVNKENSLVFPEVIYKPAKNAVITKDKGIKLPNEIDRLITNKPTVIKHQGRIGGAMKKDSVSKKLLEEDLTIDSSVSLNTTEDISIRFAKNAYII